MSSERGQASVEWVALLLLVSLLFAAALAFVPVDGRPAARRRDRSGAGVRGAAATAGRRASRCVARIRRPRRRARARRCAEHRLRAGHAHAAGRLPPLPLAPLLGRARRPRPRRAAGRVRGKPATAFTHVVHRGGRTYIQYWLYYPDSPSTFMGSHAILKTLGHPRSGLPSGRLGGLPGADRPRRPQAGCARPRTATTSGASRSVQVMPALGPVDRLDARVARIARRPHPAEDGAEAEEVGRRDPLPPGAAGRRPPRALDHVRRASSWSRSRRSTTRPTSR